jgi:hypothetical protein
MQQEISEEQEQEIAAQADGIRTEEATKTAFVLPFISALGYDVFDPTQVMPEYIATIGDKSEKVDYAILRDGSPIMVFECKWCGISLDEGHWQQLDRYFRFTDARIGVLTNGIEYQLFADLDERNRLDKRPFLVVDMMDLHEPLVAELKRLSKDEFDTEEVISVAAELKYSRELRRLLAREFASPDDDFLRFLIDHVYDGKITANVKQRFSPIVKTALRQFLNDMVDDRLRTALKGGTDAGGSGEDKERAGPDGAVGHVVEPAPDKPAAVTTAEEIEAYYIVKSILHGVVDPERVAMRDVISYCGILLDDNNRKPICRLHFNSSQKYLGLFDRDKHEKRVPIERIDDIFDYRDQIRATPSFYE